MRFTIESEFNPTGDQPDAISQLTQGIDNKERYQTLLGVTGSGKTFTVANVIQEVQKPTLVLAHNKTLAAQLYSEFKQFFPNNAVEYFVSYYDYYQPEAYIPVSGVYIEKDLSINEEIEKMRLRRTKLLHRLVQSLYSRTEAEFNHGNFRIKGDTVDVFPSYADDAFRIHFFGDEIEEIEAFNIQTNEVVEKYDRLNIYPANMFVTSPEVLQGAIHDIQEDLVKQHDYFKDIGKHLEAKRLKERTEFDLEMIRELGYCSGIENYSRYLDGRAPGTRPFCLLDYFPDDYLMVVDESHVTISQVHAMYGGDRSRKENLVEYGFRLPAAMDNRPLKFEEFEALQNQVIYVSATPADYELQKTDGVYVEQVIRPTGLLDPIIEVRPSLNQIDDLIEGLDLPEVSLVAILDADKEGFLRSARSLTQTVGRAARNLNGKAIMYADKITKSMQKTIDETNYRREKQIAYNTEHNITPKALNKSLDNALTKNSVSSYYYELEAQKAAEPESDYLTKPELEKKIRERRKLMEQAAKELDFMLAAKLRDEIKGYQGKLEELKI